MSSVHLSTCKGQKTIASRFDPGVAVGDASPLLRLQIALIDLPVPLADSAEIHEALRDLDQYDRGEVRELSGLPAWLDFLRAPYAEDEPLDAADVLAPRDEELAGAIAAALEWVEEHPEPPQDSHTAIREMLKRSEPGEALRFDPHAAPPFDRFHALCDSAPAFKRALDHKRPDLVDQSIEGYDAVLAEHAAADGWSDQEILDLLIHHHSKWLEDPLPDTAIIEAARKRASGADAPRDEPERPVAASVVELSPAVATIRRGLGIPVARVRKLGRKRGVFELVLEDNSVVELGTASNVQSHREVSAAVFDAVGRTIQPLKGELWRKVVDAIGKAATVEETGSAPEEETMHWVRSAARNSLKLKLDRDKPGETAKLLRDGADAPVYLGNDELFVCLPALIRHVHINHGVRPTWPEMALRLRRLGFRPELVSARDKEGVAKARLWTSPRGFKLEQ